MTDVGLTPVQLGWILAAFAWGYALFQLPGGMLGDVLGGRRALALVAGLWGALNVLVALVPSGAAQGSLVVIASLVTLRFLMGAAQAPLFPVLGGSVIARWFPVSGLGPPERDDQHRLHPGRRGHRSAGRLAGAGLRLAGLVRAHRAAGAPRRGRLVLVCARRARRPSGGAAGRARADRCRPSTRDDRGRRRPRLEGDAPRPGPPTHHPQLLPRQLRLLLLLQLALLLPGPGPRLRGDRGRPARGGALGDRCGRGHPRVAGPATGSGAGGGSTGDAVW